MFEYKVALGLLATLMALVAYTAYFRNILSGKTKPHAFSWLVWGLLAGIAFAAQVAGNAGAGAWVTGFTSLACFVIFGLALVKGERRFILFDWTCLFAALAAIALWYFTKQPLLSILLIIVIDTVAFLPTIRKGYYKPYEETAVTYAFSGAKFFIGILALETFSFVTWLYPAWLVTVNYLFVALLLVRRRQNRSVSPK